MGQSFSVIPPSLKRKRDPESEDQNQQARKVLVVQDPNKEVQSNSTTRTTSSSSQSGWNYDVFLSFRGEDTRKNFTDHLYSALVGVGIRTFRDDEELRSGENISTELLNAICGSRISIVVFSECYASSRWCLDELVEIMHCRNTIGHTLLPIFYHMNPSDVRHQIGTFAKAFAGHEKRFQTDMERVRRWRAALTEAASCSGWDLNNVANGYESRFIKVIVEEVLCKVNPALLNVAKHPIGMKSRVDDIKVLLNLGTRDVRVVGIYGMGGIDKTTLAKAVYNEICDAFEGNSFLSNLKESSEKPDGLIHLQNQLLSDILKMNSKIVNVDRGTNIIQHRIHGKKVLVILDDVDDFGNLHMLVEKHWLGPGSRIIITTRDEHLLTQLEVDEKYEVEILNDWESLQLFNWHAFKMTNPNPNGDYSKLSIEAVNYAGGLPLALEVLGSFLKGRSTAEWKSELDKLQRTPHQKIQKILRISFDSLDRIIKHIFLDIACFFVGMDKEYTIKILDGCNFFPESGIPILIQMSLVTIDYQNKLKMHNLIRDMGREIVCEESPKYPGKRSRLWFYKDVLNVLHKPTGSKKVEGLILNPPLLEDVKLETKAFKKMTNLRLLQINDVQLTGSYECLSKELKWLCWHKCPLKSLPQDFHLENLVILDMQHSKVKRVWKKKNKIFNKLKVLNLSNSKYLTRSPDFSQALQLEVLIFEGCTNLVEVHESIGHLKRLVLLNLENCTNLKYLPRSIFNLESLETLDLSGCLAFEKLPNQQPSSFGLFMNLKTASFSGCSSLITLPNFLHVPHLESLKLDGCTSLVEIHKSIGLLKRLVLLNLRSCVKLRNLPNSISNLESLETLDLWGCFNLENLPEQIGNMTALKKLEVSFTAIKQLPEFSQTSHMEELILETCTSLVKIHESIGHLKGLKLLDLAGCKKLRGLPISCTSNLKSLQNLILSDCSELDKLPEQWGNMMALSCLVADGTTIEQIPLSLGLLSSLSILKLPGCGGMISPHSSNRISLLSISKLCSLTRLDLSCRNLSEDEIPIEFECLSLLEVLDLSRNNFRNLPSCIGRLPKLELLILNECTTLQSISLLCNEFHYHLKANGCTSLERISVLTNESSGYSDLDNLDNWCEMVSTSIDLDNCPKLAEIQNLESLQRIPVYVRMGSCNNLSSDFRESVLPYLLQTMCKTGDADPVVFLPGSEIPNWISHQAIGSSISFCVPPLLEGKIDKVLFCIVYAINKEAPRDILEQSGYLRWKWRFCNKSSRDQSDNWDDWDDVPHTHPITPAFHIFEDHIHALKITDSMWIERLQMNSGDEIEFAVDLQMRHQGFIHNSKMCEIDSQIMEVKRCGIHLSNQ
ncbi:disease resistance protein RPV1-like [Alnus glutinosa]|uniref:disease resistance protein RPV1-like n=1 Tax=Alnus glutinosa TaxID=3517 RepID=UPI002D78ACA7|nr:disease resistance protein RPV1-like [Alnus glutinosa]XP_062171820.1 disease resistance protein RPV1-like [Alnus glutinosa]